jgi:hypothetical protein
MGRVEASVRWRALVRAGAASRGMMMVAPGWAWTTLRGVGGCSAVGRTAGEGGLSWVAQADGAMSRRGARIVRAMRQGRERGCLRLGVRRADGDGGWVVYLAG